MRTEREIEQQIIRLYEKKETEPFKSDIYDVEIQILKWVLV